MALPVILYLLLLKPQVFYLGWIHKHPTIPSTSTISEQQVIALIFRTTLAWGLTDGKIVLEDEVITDDDICLGRNVIAICQI